MPTYSSRLAIPAPATTDLVSAGPANFTSANAIVDAAFGLEWGDLLQPGVVGTATIVNSTGPTINSATGVITQTCNPDTAWVSSGGVLTRVVLPTAGIALTPSALPTAGNYMNVGIFVTPAAGPPVWNATGVLSAVSGTSQGSQVAAVANPVGTPAATLPLQQVIVLNTAGVYSIATTVDVRTFAAYGLSNRAWVSYVPVWTAAVVNPVLGNGTLSGAYQRIGKTVTLRIYLAIGASTTQGTGQWSLTLPVSTKADATYQSLGGVAFANSIAYPLTSVLPANSTSVPLWTSALVVGPGQPNTWTTGNVLVVQGVYESV